MRFGRTIYGLGIRLSLCVAMSLAVSCARGSSKEAPECRFTSDCEQGQRCEENRCIVSTGDGAMCPPGQIIVEGVCQIDDSRCREDSDCPDGRCVDGECFANQCSDGEERACDTVCGGTQACRDGVWRPCPQPTTEVCGDGRDNDCDGETDEGCEGCVEGQRQPCQTACGIGEEMCAGNVWRFCTAPIVHPEICGNDEDEDCDGVLNNGCENCEDGDERPCGNESCAGTEVCVDRTWTNCTARAPEDELCDGQDNDCDGETDEEIARSCANACGDGWELCKMGNWTMCTAPENCACGDGDPADVQICGTCGVRERSCDSATWGPWSECSESIDECSPGEAEEAPCGNCGTHTRRCTAECRWGDWQPCSAEGECVPGVSDETSENELCPDLGRTCSLACEWTVDCGRAGPSACPEPGAQETEPCGNCGVRRRSCSDCCGWGEWGACEEPEDACEPGVEEGVSCGPNCAVRRRTCNDECQWSEFGECDEGGQCSPRQTDMEECGNCGTRSRACNDLCIWEDWGVCADEGACAPGERIEQACGTAVGQCIPGVQAQSCNLLCQWGEFSQCAEGQGPEAEICGNGRDEDCDGVDPDQPDQFDRPARNDTCDSCTVLNQIRADGSIVPDVNTSLNATIDRVGDRDYYCVHTEDHLNAPGNGESFNVGLSEIPAGNDYNVYLFRNVDDCRAGNPLAAGRNLGNRDESIGWGERRFRGDGGTYIILVEGVGIAQECNLEYRLSVRGLN